MKIAVGAGVVEGTGQLAQRLAHESRLQADVAVAHLALDLGARHEGRHGVDDDDVDGAGADQHVGDLERLLAGVGLRHEQGVGVDAELLRVVRVERVLGVDERRDAAGLLRVGDRVEGDGRLARGLRAVDLDDAPARQTADAERDVEGDRPGGDHLDGRTDVVAEAHHRALAVALLDLAHHRGEGLVLVLFLHRSHVGHLSAVCVAVVYLRPGPRPRAARSAVGSDARCRRRHRVGPRDGLWTMRVVAQDLWRTLPNRCSKSARHADPGVSVSLSSRVERPVERGVRRVGEEPEPRLAHARVHASRRCRQRLDRDLRSRVERVAVDPARDGREGEHRAAGGRRRPRPTGRSSSPGSSGSPSRSPAPDRADRVDDVPHGQPTGAGDLRVAGVAPAEEPALGEQSRPGCPVDRAVDTAAAQQGPVRGVDDGVGRGVGS